MSLLKYGDMGKCSHKSPSPCNTYVVPMSLYKFVSSYVRKKNVRAHTLTHTHWYWWFTGTLHSHNDIYTLTNLAFFSIF